MFGWLRRRRLNEAAQRRLTIALARAEEELIDAHVRNLVDFHEAVGRDLPLEDAMEAYFEALDPGERLAEIITRRVLARLESTPRPRGRLRS